MKLFIQNRKMFFDLSKIPVLISLAIAIGTAHGIYPAGKIPKLRLDILKEIDAITPVPLVLHGGSSLIMMKKFMKLLRME